MRSITRRRTWSGLTLALAGAGAALAAPGAERPALRWAKSWEAAVEEAQARNVPIFVSFHMDN